MLFALITIGYLLYLAEKAGFEPAVRYKRTLAFQASALNHSATSPAILNPIPVSEGGIDSDRLRAIFTYSIVSVGGRSRQPEPGSRGGLGDASGMTISL